jgi:predicted RNA-binding protein
LIWNTYYANGEVLHATNDKGSFWWKDILKLANIFRGVASYKVGDGTTMLFWSDIWNDHLMQHQFPRLFSYAKNKNISVVQFLLNNSIETQFHLPLSE